MNARNWSFGALRDYRKIPRLLWAAEELKDGQQGLCGHVIYFEADGSILRKFFFFFFYFLNYHL